MSLQDVPSPFIAGVATRPHDACHQQADLFDSDYESYASEGIQAFGRQASFDVGTHLAAVQASFDILTSGRTDRGMRVTIEPANAVGANSNGYKVSVTVGAALSVDVDGSAKTVTIVVAATTTMSQLSSELDSTAQVSTAFFGGEGGNGTIGAQDVADSAGGSDAGVTKDRGLRVTIQRGASRKGPESNGYAISVTVGNALAVTLTDTAGSEGVAIVLAAATTMAQLKTAVDAVAGLNSAYFGGETGTGATDEQDVADSAGGTPDRWSIVEISPSGGGFVFIGESAPANDDSAILLWSTRVDFFAVPPGHEVWLKREGSTDRRGSIRIWRAPHRAAA